MQQRHSPSPQEQQRESVQNVSWGALSFGQKIFLKKWNWFAALWTTGSLVSHALLYKTLYKHKINSSSSQLLHHSRFCVRNARLCCTTHQTCFDNRCRELLQVRSTTLELFFFFFYFRLILAPKSLCILRLHNWVCSKT